MHGKLGGLSASDVGNIINMIALLGFASGVKK
jgi:hypothetical protein